MERFIDNLAEFMKNNKNAIVNEIEFEKDDDSNGHIDFIAYFSNFRAGNYSIEPLPSYQIKLKAGKIIPAIATTTSLICGQVFTEVLKYYLRVPFEQYRMFFCSLSVNDFHFSEPMPPMVTRDKEYDVILMGPLKTIPKNFNTWS